MMLQQQFANLKEFLETLAMHATLPRSGKSSDKFESIPLLHQEIHMQAAAPSVVSRAQNREAKMNGSVLKNRCKEPKGNISPPQKAIILMGVQKKTFMKS